MEFQPDNSGIKSLGGFAFQIKVFCNLCSQLSEGQQIEFESIDDVTTNRNVKADSLDNINGKICSPVYDSIQVKHTSITEDIAKKVLMNWIQSEASPLSIKNYYLITDMSYSNTDLLSTINSESFIQEVLDSSQKRNANITKVKTIFQKNDLQENKKIIKDILQKYKFLSLNIDDELDNNFKNIFLKSVNKVVYYQRLEEFLCEITNKIMNSVLKSQSFILTYMDFQKIVNDIIQRFTVEISLPSYNNFKNINPFDLDKIESANSREYKQLLHCDVSENAIRRHLLHEQYYRKVRNNYIDACMNSKCENIEVTAYENFENVKEDLQDRNADLPKNRLKETTEASNSYAESNQIREGVCIYLTSYNIDKNNQISWTDE